MAESFLVPKDKYLEAGIHIGTKYKTKHMSNFIYKVKQDGLIVMNLEKIDERLKIVADFISRYKPEEIVVVCKRENGWQPLTLFSKMTGIKVFAGRYKPGILTNLALENFMEFKLMIVVDPWLDKNAVNDAINAGIPIVGFCDTNNTANNIDLVLPCNNKGRKSLGIVFWILAREYLHQRGILEKGKEPPYSLEEFIED